MSQRDLVRTVNECACEARSAMPSARRTRACVGWRKSGGGDSLALAQVRRRSWRDHDACERELRRWGARAVGRERGAGRAGRFVTRGMAPTGNYVSPPRCELSEIPSAGLSERTFPEFGAIPDRQANAVGRGALSRLSRAHKTRATHLRSRTPAALATCLHLCGCVGSEPRHLWCQVRRGSRARGVHHPASGRRHHGAHARIPRGRRPDARAAHTTVAQHGAQRVRHLLRRLRPPPRRTDDGSDREDAERLATPEPAAGGACRRRVSDSG